MAEEDENRRTVIVLRPRRMAMLVALFMRPTHALLAMQFHRCWVPALLCTLLVLCIGSCQRAYRRVKVAMPVARSIVSDVAKDVTPITWADGKLIFPETLELPYSKCVKDWQIDVQSPTDKLCTPAKLEAGQGLVLSSENVLYWMDLGNGRSVSRVLMNNAQLRQLTTLFERNGDRELNYDKLQLYVDAACVVSFPIVACYVFLTLVGIVLMTFAMFCAAMFLMRRETRQSKGCTLILLVNSLMPPTVLSTVWYMFTPLSWDFSNLFLLATVAYLFIIFMSRSKPTPQEA